VKRDWNLIRQILLELEKDPDPPVGPRAISIDGAAAEAVSYHVMLMSQAGLIEAENCTSTSGFDWLPIGLTWNGHELLDSIRKDSVWRAVTKRLAAHGTTVGIGIVTELANHFVRNELQS
jgi:predicted transcriptional regulator